MLNLTLLIAALALPAVLAGEYTAGVANHDVFFGTDSDSPAYLIDMNLQLYENLTEVAGEAGTQVLVFPEFGLQPVKDASRKDLYPFAESVPDSGSLVTPCDDAASFSDRPILYRMSCAAREHSMIILVNMVDWQTCSETDENCPEDGHYQYNTDVLFDEKGVIVAKYHKTHVWLANLDKYDTPVPTEYVTYKSESLGVEFGLFICFDIMFPEPAKVLVDQGVKHFLYAVQQAYFGDLTLMPTWSKNNEAALLASNLQVGGKDSTKENFSRMFVKGDVVRGTKHALKNDQFSYENVLVAKIPIEF